MTDLQEDAFKEINAVRKIGAEQLKLAEREIVDRFGTQ